MRAMPRDRLCWFRVVLLAVLVPGTGQAEDAVLVRMEADRTTVVLGQTTTVRVFGQIDPHIESANQIFSWYIDVHNNNGPVLAGYANVQKITSDQGDASSDGTLVGDDLLGIYDFFLGTPGAGNGSPVELVRFDVKALAVGVATLSAAPGTTGPGTFDFVVSKATGDPRTGGNYDAAAVTISVLAPPDPAELDPVVTIIGNTTEISFQPIEGFAHTVQWSPDVHPDRWTDLPGGPHDSGSVTDDVTDVARRWYRVVAVLP